jgi:transposase
LIAYLVTSKYVDSLPLYRLEAIAQRHHVRLPRTTQAAWMIALPERLQPLMNLMDERLRASGYVRIDETRLQVLKSDKAPSALHWMWVRVAGPAAQRIILFDYDPSRGGEVADALLEGCSGYLQSDGYQTYQGVSARARLIHVGCFAHSRRRFFDALKALPDAQRKAATTAHEAVRRIDALYSIEREIKDLSNEERTRIRQLKSVPRLQSLHEWASRMQRKTLPSGKHRRCTELSTDAVAKTPTLYRGRAPRNRHQPRRERNPALRFGSPKLAFRRHRQGRQSKRRTLQHRLHGTRKRP